ncbi:MAG: hypothetical protein K8953_09305, partial [Proteobacteria bacterium]|nr:hypothetical protein [Pseudomonadota bacterium]
RDLFCGDQLNYFNTLCDGFGTITTLRTNLCGEDGSPFDARCTDTYLNEEAQQTRTALCFMAGNAADNDRCGRAIMANGCIENPFGDGCDVMHQRTRLSYCAGDVGVADFALSLCSSGAQDMICGMAGQTGFGTNPFASLCQRDGVDFAAQRIYYCGTQDRTTTEMAQCAGLGVTDCLSNPFDMACETTASDYYAELRTLRADYCGNLGNDATRLNLAQTNSLCNNGTIDAVCGTGYGAEVANPFALICGADYADERGLACLQLAEVDRPPTCGTSVSGDIFAYCTTPEGRKDATNCGTEAVRMCRLSPFNMDCGMDFDPIRRLACIEDPSSDKTANPQEFDRCPGLIVEYCNDETPNLVLNAFHVNCAGIGNSDAIRGLACFENPDINMACGDNTSGALATYCTQNPFAGTNCNGIDGITTARDNLLALCA